MALVIADRVRETSTTTGTGTLTLAGAVSGFQTFSTAIGNTNTCYYTIVNGSEWEVGLGTVAAGTLARTTVLKSSNAGSAVDFSAGTKDVFATYPADKSVLGSTAKTLGGVGYGDGTSLAFTSAGTSGQVLTSSGAAAPAWSNVPTVSLTTGVSGVLPIANGGTNSTATPTAGGAGYGTGTANAYTAAGTSGQILTSAGSSAPTWSSAFNGTIGATTPSTVVATQVDITATGNLRLQDTTGGQYVALKAPGTVATSYALTMPTATGTSGQFLSTDGSGNLSFATAGGAWTLLATITAASSTNLTFDNYFTSAYDQYALVGNQIRSAQGQSGGDLLRLDVNYGGYSSTDFIYTYTYTTSNSTTMTIANATTAASLYISPVGLSCESADFVVFLHNPLGSTNKRTINITSTTMNSSIVYRFNSSGQSYVTTPYTGVRVRYSLGSVESGIARLYGIKN